MYEKARNSWLKHLDFILLDLLCFQLSFSLSYYILQHLTFAYSVIFYRYQAIVLVILQLLIVFFTQPYKDIVRRGPYKEFVKTVQYAFLVMFADIVYLFAVHQIIMISRRFFIMTTIFFIVSSYIVRSLNKIRIGRKSNRNAGKRSLFVITIASEARHVVEELQKGSFSDFFITGVELLGSSTAEVPEINGIPVYGRGEDIFSRISHEWVDEVLFYLPPNYPLPESYIDKMLEMGITIHYSFSVLNQETGIQQETGKLGDLHVLTNSLRIVTVQDLALKRAMDILGGLVGCLLTGIICIFIGPAIYIQSPGPIFFTQWRIGKNGKKFKMYKFRSMYMDAEERKKEYMAQNKISDGLMFKMEDDPRIIGSEKKDRNGRPRGIGNFIRNTSLDEFPQFWNVLKGDMSLVGTRPPTVDEWERYDLHHRVRMSVKPGITGMWQVSGRSKITDFEEVVRLDTEYIRNWSWMLDIQILLKTVAVVLKHEGAS